MSSSLVIHRSGTRYASPLSNQSTQQNYLIWREDPSLTLLSEPQATAQVNENDIWAIQPPKIGYVADKTNRLESNSTAVKRQINLPLIKILTFPPLQS